MSRAAEGYVWERSRAKGSNLLVLLKVADFANDEGRDAFPSAATLAKWTRLTPRAVRQVLHKLEAEGELIIELNTDRRSITIGRRTLQPDWFIHVRCVCEWASYHAEQSEKFSSSPFRVGRRPVLVESEKFADSRRSETGKVFPGNRKNSADQSEKSSRAYKEEILELDPRTREQKQSASPTTASDQTPDPEKQSARPTTPEQDDPEQNIAIITKLAHDTIDLIGIPEDQGELREAVKAACASYRVAYNGSVIRRAVESAIFQRNRKASA